jgi:hypothetical protein
MTLVVTAGTDKLRVKQVTLIVKNKRTTPIEISAGEELLLWDDEAPGGVVKLLSNEALTIEPQCTAALLLNQ